MGVSKKGNKQKEYPMTRKDFQLIADVIKGHTDGKDDHVMRGFALSMVVELQKDNPRFDRVRFLEACGVA